MVDRRVQLFLKTPLFRFKYTENDVVHELPGQIAMVEGVISGEFSGGFQLKELTFRHADGSKVEGAQNVDEILIPGGKVDFARFLG